MGLPLNAKMMYCFCGASRRRQPPPPPPTPPTTHLPPPATSGGSARRRPAPRHPAPAASPRPLRRRNLEQTHRTLSSLKWSLLAFTLACALALVAEVYLVCCHDDGASDEEEPLVRRGQPPPEYRGKQSTLCDER